jgi:hypothetical protein
MSGFCVFVFKLKTEVFPDLRIKMLMYILATPQGHVVSAVCVLVSFFAYKPCCVSTVIVIFAVPYFQVSTRVIQ